MTVVIMLTASDLKIHLIKDQRMHERGDKRKKNRLPFFVRIHLYSIRTNISKCLPESTKQS